MSQVLFTEFLKRLVCDQVCLHMCKIICCSTSFLMNNQIRLPQIIQRQQYDLGFISSSLLNCFVHVVILKADGSCFSFLIYSVTSHISIQFSVSYQISLVKVSHFFLSSIFESINKCRRKTWREILVIKPQCEAHTFQEIHFFISLHIGCHSVYKNVAHHNDSHLT